MHRHSRFLEDHKEPRRHEHHHHYAYRSTVATLGCILVGFVLVVVLFAVVMGVYVPLDRSVKTIPPTTQTPTRVPTTLAPSDSPTTAAPSETPTEAPTEEPTTAAPSDAPSESPTDAPSESPTETPTIAPTHVACPEPCNGILWGGMSPSYGSNLTIYSTTSNMSLVMGTLGVNTLDISWDRYGNLWAINAAGTALRKVNPTFTGLDPSPIYPLLAPQNGLTIGCDNFAYTIGSGTIILRTNLSDGTCVLLANVSFAPFALGGDCAFGLDQNLLYFTVGNTTNSSLHVYDIMANTTSLVMPLPYQMSGLAFCEDVAWANSIFNDNGYLVTLNVSAMTYSVIIYNSTNPTLGFGGLSFQI